MIGYEIDFVRLEKMHDPNRAVMCTNWVAYRVVSSVLRVCECLDLALEEYIAHYALSLAMKTQLFSATTHVESAPRCL